MYAYKYFQEMFFKIVNKPICPDSPYLLTWYTHPNKEIGSNCTSPAAPI